jgi:hypothetical protein
VTRPPRPETRRPVRTDLVVENDRLDYLPIDFEGFVDLAKRVAGGAIAPSAGDPTHTLYELSALVAHVLAVHQDYYAGEAFLRTATSPRQLVRHGRRFGYEPSPGSTAVGFLEIAVKPELAGDLPAGIVVSTMPRAGANAEDFSTLTSRYVDARWNRIEIRASDREAAIPIAASATSLRVRGTNLGVRAGQPAMLVGPAATTPIGLDIASVSEVNGETLIVLSRALGTAIPDPAGYHLVGAPSLELRLFGWDADPVVFPATQLETSVGYSDPGSHPTITYGYAAPSSPTTDKIFLAQAIDDQIVGQRVLVAKGTTRTVHTVTAQENVGVQFNRGGWRQELDRVDVTPETATTPIVIDPVFTNVIDKRSVSASVTQLQLGATRATVGVHSTLYTLWTVEAPLVARTASSTPAIPNTDVHLDGEHALEPGMLVALQTRDQASAQIVELFEVEASGGTTRVKYSEITSPPHAWTRGDMVVLGNVVRVAHGTMRDEILGESDGVTPFQRFKLKKTPVGYLATGDGVIPDIEVRVGNVRWDRVIDLGIGETPRRYKLEREHDGTTWIVFGDSRSCGAIPPAGRGNITARYRVGLGAAGNVDAGRIAQLQKSHPLVDRVSNPVATDGGTEPAASEDVRTHATRYIRTFDRAVSLRDHADLALLFPGVARAAAHLVDGAIELTAATASGEPLVNSQELFDSLDKKRDTALRLVRKDPDDVAVAIRVYYEADDAFVLRDVEAAIRDALHGTDPAAPGLFTFAARDLGQAAHASEVHGVLSTVPGVTFVQVLRFDLDPGTGLRDVLQPQPHQWLRLHATGLTFGESTEADHD